MKQHSFFYGCALGILAPAAAHLLTVFTDLETAVIDKPLSLYVVSALINLLLIRYFYRNALEQNARGVILITFVAAIALVFGQKLIV